MIIHSRQYLLKLLSDVQEMQINQKPDREVLTRLNAGVCFLKNPPQDVMVDWKPLSPLESLGLSEEEKVYRMLWGELE